MNPYSIGIDGCKAGWLLTICSKDNLYFRLVEKIEDATDYFKKASLVFIDIPMGLTDKKISRELESEMRAILKPLRHSSVFEPPCRAAAYEEDYARASEINYQTTGKKLSKQSYNISRKIREVDSFLYKNKNFGFPFYESHPEVCFAKLNGSVPMKYPKKTTEGIQNRIDILKKFHNEVENTFNKIRSSFKKTALNDDDIVDSLVLSVSGWLAQENGVSLINNSKVKDSKGIPMRIAFYKVE